ncbi:S-adenosyl-L-methionine-dependent methyltransferase [Rhypophila decipiens]|uniref:S-adenosyl-L-methionine-dependent methyltransferase n=1 Tax=Rhypophila decipiens TaxID=261697 RepID=A0AAN6Y3V6_9PEZI|nr:S-adenosyl-L-methionine-dependent methyltransferase [Rhypophila decipiens]
MSKSLQYVLGRGLGASTRLNFQHSILKEHLNGLVHSKVPLPPRPVIADIGTGTGIWPVEVLTRLKWSKDGVQGAQLHGFDVSKDQFPHESLLPKQVSLHQQDAFGAYPDKFVGKFDLVHVRAFVSIINPDNIKPFLRGITSLLKPGGFLQWVDLNPINTEIRYIGRGPDPKPGHIQYAVDQYKAFRGVPIFSDLDKHTLGHGLQLVSHDASRLEGFMLPLWFQNEVMALEDFYVRPAKMSGDPAKIQQAEETVASFINEAQSGAYISPEVFVRVMQKA